MIGRLLAMGLLAAIGCSAEGRARPGATDGARLERARIDLAASFIGGGAAGLRELLHRDLIVQPPEPDSAVRGAAAADYLLRLARRTEAERSHLLPSAIDQEGGFLFEQGTWVLGAAMYQYRSRYTIRWRDGPGGWQIVLLRWTLFR